MELIKQASVKGGLDFRSRYPSTVEMFQNGTFNFKWIDFTQEKE